jgi:hypothetical protein
MRKPQDSKARPALQDPHARKKGVWATHRENRQDKAKRRTRGLALKLHGRTSAAPRLFGRGLGGDGVHGAKGVDKGDTGVHDHGNDEGSGDFFLGGTRLEGGIGVEGDAAIATRGDGHGQRDELADLLTEMGAFGVGIGKSLVTFEGVGESLANSGIALRSSDLLAFQSGIMLVLLSKLGGGRSIQRDSRRVTFRSLLEPVELV